MKQLNKLTAYAIAIAVTFSACKEDDVAENDPTTGKTEIPDSFSSFTTEQNKANLEDNGIELIQEVDDLKNSDGVNASSSFAYFLNKSESSGTNSRVFETFRILSSFSKGKADMHDVTTSLRTTAEEPQSIQEFYDTYVGRIEWNSKTNEWDFTEEGDQIVFVFPSSEEKTTNDAELYIHSYEGIESPNPLGEEYEGDLPTKLKMELKVEGQPALNYDFSANYNQDGEPTSVNTALSINNYTIAFKVRNDGTDAGAAYSFTKGDKTLMAMGVGVQGEFTTDHINEVEASETSNAGDIFNGVNAYFQLMDIKIAGDANMEKLFDEVDSLYASYDHLTYEERDKLEKEKLDKEAEVMNKYINLVVFYDNKKEKIADSEFYVSEDVDTYSYQKYNQSTQTYETVEVSHTYYYTDLRFIFADESKSDMETYFGEGFNELNDEWTKLIESFE